MGSLKKYFQFYRYVQWLRDKRIFFLISIKKPLALTTMALGEKILFSIISNKEYSMRYLQSYSCEKSTIYWIEHSVKRGDVVWDIGANVGAYTLLLGKLIKSKKEKGQVLSFEPESANFHSLNRNIQLNQLSEIVTAIPLAFGKEFKMGEFFLSSNEPGSATHGLNKPESDGIEFKASHRQGILSISVDQFASLENVFFPNHMKIDVDGLEGEIVDGMNETLKDKRLKSIMIEIAAELSKERIENKLIDCGFKVVTQEEWGSKSGIIKNILFER
jgi:FkbM family methyltransferase